MRTFIEDKVRKDRLFGVVLLLIALLSPFLFDLLFLDNKKEQQVNGISNVDVRH